MNKSLNTQQLTLDFPHLPSLGREDFLVANCNAEAVKVVDSWPNWPFFAVCIYGETGCGKTHLANVFAHNVAKLTNFPYRIPFIKAGNIKLNNIHQLFEQNKCLVIEDLDENINQEALFHLYNLYRDEGGNILFTSNRAPARLSLTLPDLKSRLNIVPAIEIKVPDDDLLAALLIKLFMDRQVAISPEIISYILANMERSFAYARKLVIEIDNISLAQKRTISTTTVREAINNLSNNPQGNLF